MTNKNKKRKIIPPRETLEFETGTITLMPARFESFDTITELINKYYSAFTDAVNHYAVKRSEIIDKYEDEKLRAEALIALDETYEANTQIARAILATGSEAASDARELIGACIDEGKENDLDLNTLTVVEVMICLGTCIGLNLNFFNESQDVMGLTTLFASDPAPPTGARERAREDKGKEKEKTKPGTKSLPA